MARRRRDATAAENGVRAHLRAVYERRAELVKHPRQRAVCEAFLARLAAGETVIVSRMDVRDFVSSSHQSFAVDAAGNISESPISRV